MLAAVVKFFITGEGLMRYLCTAGLFCVAQAISGSANAQQAEDRFALALEAYARTREHCVYEPVVAETLERVHRYLFKHSATYQFRDVERAADALQAMGKITVRDGRDPDCASLGIAVGDGLVLHLTIPPGLDLAVMAEVERLSGGGGRRVKVVTVSPADPTETGSLTNGDWNSKWVSVTSGGSTLEIPEFLTEGWVRALMENGVDYGTAYEPEKYSI